MIAFNSSYDDSAYDQLHWDADTARMVRVSEGDQQAFEELIDRHFRSTVRIVAAMMGSRELAEDLAQEIFLRIYRGRKRYVPTAKFSTWLGTIIRNAVLNAKRSQSRRRIREAEWVRDANVRRTTTESGIPAEVVDPSRRLVSQEAVDAVTNAVSQLPPRQRTAIELVHFNGLTYAKAAEAMETTSKAVKSLLGRGRGTLSVKLADQYEQEFGDAAL